MVKKIFVFMSILGLFFVSIPGFNVKADSVDYSDTNLASPFLAGKRPLGNGNYRLFQSADGSFSIDYNVYNGYFRYNGVMEGTGTYNVFSAFNLPTGEYTISIVKVSGEQSLGIQVDTYLRTSTTAMAGLYITDIVGDVKSETYNTTEETALYLRYRGGVEYYSYTFAIQLEIGNAASPHKVPLQAFLWHERQLEHSGYGYGYDDGFDDGKLAGLEEGEEIGYLKGLNETDATGMVGLLSAVFGGLGALLAIEILPGIYIGAIIAVPLVFGVIFFILGKRKGD